MTIDVKMMKEYYSNKKWGDVKIMTKQRFTFRPSDFVFKNASKAAKDKSISINSEINGILSTYYQFLENNPQASVWQLIQGGKNNARTKDS